MNEIKDLDSSDLKDEAKNSNVFTEAIRLWLSFMELNKQQSTKIQYLIMMIRALLTVVIFELGVLIGLLIYFVTVTR